MAEGIVNLNALLENWVINLICEPNLWKFIARIFTQVAEF